jgi:hypothetical protein
MSHTTAIKGVNITNIDALRAAIEELAEKGIKINLTEGGTPRSYYSAHGREQEGMGKADFVIGLADAAYDIGLYLGEDGVYEARTDFWNYNVKSVESVLGAAASAPEYETQAKMGKLFQAYAIHATLATARMQGKSVQRITKKDGTEQLVVAGF